MRRVARARRCVVVRCGGVRSARAGLARAARRGPHWLPNEEWVNNLWLPYDEQRLVPLLGRTRGEVFRWVRVDATTRWPSSRARRGWTLEGARRARSWRRGASEVSARRPAALRRARRAHADPGPPRPAPALPRAAPDGDPEPRDGRSSASHDREEFLNLRRAELSPLQIGELNGSTRAEMQSGVRTALRDAAPRAACARGSLPPAQAA